MTDCQLKSVTDDAEHYTVIPGQNHNSRPDTQRSRYPWFVNVLLVSVLLIAGWHRLARLGAYRCALAQEVRWNEILGARTSSGDRRPGRLKAANRGHRAGWQTIWRGDETLTLMARGADAMGQKWG